MIEYICDICKKRITRPDIHVKIDCYIGPKSETIDLHSLCYYAFIRELGNIIDADPDTVTIKRENIGG